MYVFPCVGGMALGAMGLCGLGEVWERGCARAGMGVKVGRSADRRKREREREIRVQRPRPPRGGRLPRRKCNGSQNG